MNWQGCDDGVVGSMLCVWLWCLWEIQLNWTMSANCFSFWALRPSDPLRGLHPWTPLLNLCTQTLYGGFILGPHCWTCVPRPSTGASPLDPTAEPVYPDPLRGLHLWTPLLNLCTQTLYGGFTLGPHCWICVPRPSTRASPLDPTAEPVYPDPLRGLHPWTPLLNLCTQTLYEGFTFGPHCWTCVPRPCLLYTSPSPRD